MTSSRSGLLVAQPLHPSSLERVDESVAARAPAANSEPAADPQPAPIAALDALALCAQASALGG